MNGRFSLSFRVGQTVVTVSFWFLLLICGMTLFDRTHTAAVCLPVIFLHEIMHIAVMTAKGSPPRALELSVFGMRLTEGRRLGYRDEVLVALAGPLINLLLGVIFTLCVNGAILFGLTNLFIGLFNLIPIEPLDGYHVMYGLIHMYHKNVLAAQLLCRVLTCVFFALMLVLAVGLFYYGRANLTLFVTICYLGVMAVGRKNLK